jgi:RNA polymerase sigma factor (sigma-70 family)
MDAVIRRRPRLALPRRALRLVGDERLVDELRAESVSAFEEIYDRHHRGILAFCRHMLGSQQEAEDAVQHTFIAAHRSLVADDRQIALKAWLYVVARNRCLSLLRARHEDADIDDVTTVMPETVGLAAEVESREDLRALLADMQLLPENQRAALVLAELRAHSHNEIAVILDIPPAKVKALVFQARKSLMNRRLARGANCDEIREQLAVVRGGAVPRGQLRHHVEQCEGCRTFAGDVRRQRAAFSVLLPVVPSLALKHSTLTAALTAGGSGAVAAGGGAAGGAATLAGGTAASATAGGTAAAGGGMAAAGGVAGGSGSAGLTGGVALLGAKAIAAKAMIAVALTAVAGGGYVAVEHHANDQAPAAPAHATPSGQAPKPMADPSVGAVVGASTADPCLKEPATAQHPCRDHASAAKADRDADGVPNHQDACPNKSASTPNGCPDTTPADPPSNQPPADPTPPDRDGDGVPNRQDTCPNKPATTPNGCPDSTPSTGPTP